MVRGAGTLLNSASNDISWVARDESQLTTAGAGQIYLSALGTGATGLDINLKNMSSTAGVGPKYR